jgi:hypothetical protein
VGGFQAEKTAALEPIMEAPIELQQCAYGRSPFTLAPVAPGNTHSRPQTCMLQPPPERIGVDRQMVGFGEHLPEERRSVIGVGLLVDAQDLFLDSNPIATIGGLTSEPVNQPLVPIAPIPIQEPVHLSFGDAKDLGRLGNLGLPMLDLAKYL